MSATPDGQDVKEKLIIYFKLLNFSSAHHSIDMTINDIK
jgi:hypothetical protein